MRLGGQAAVNGFDGHIRLQVGFGLRQFFKKGVFVRGLHVLHGGGEEFQSARVAAQGLIGAAQFSASILASFEQGCRQLKSLRHLQKVAVIGMVERQVFAVPVGNQPARGGQQDQICGGLRGLHPCGNRFILERLRIGVLDRFEIVEEKDHAPVALFHQQVEHELGALHVVRKARAEMIVLLAVLFIQREFQLEFELPPRVFFARAPGEDLCAAFLQVERQFARQRSLALSAGRSDQQAVELALEQAVLIAAQLGAPADKTRGQADLAECIFEQARAVNFTAREVPINQRLARAGGDQHRQAPLSQAEFRQRARACLFARDILERGLDGNARGLQGKVNVFLIGERIAQGARKLNAGPVQNRFAHPDHVRNALRADALGQAIVQRLRGRRAF